MKIASNKIKDVVRFFKEELKNIYDQDELETIIAYCFEAYLKMKRSDINLLKENTMSESELLKFNFAVKQLKTNKPIQYILGEADFYKLKFKVNEHVLIPRPETEELVDLIVKEFKVQSSKFQNNSIVNTEYSILDIGTGSGCIPIALKKNIPGAALFAMDISEDALRLAKENADLNNADVTFIPGDILDPAFNIPDMMFDMIVSNPPYICISEKESMQKNVLDHEPHLALFVNDNDPLLFYKAIADFALKCLKNNGLLYFEINRSFGPESKHMLENKGFKNVELIKDLSNNYRILRGYI